MLLHLVSEPYFSQLLEALLTLLLLLLAWARPELGSRLFAQIESWLKHAAARPGLATLSIVAGVIGARLLLLPLMPVPHPFVHDEFSYLLAGETFAGGRLSNPTPPSWPHFESVHILQRPTYMSMYPPAQGMVLAVGLLLFSHPWVGVLISNALLCGTLFWALRGWFSNPWALAITLLAAIRWGLVSYWMNSYWGGAVPALGGTLIFGSIPRLVQSGKTKYWLAFACGIAILANSRPYEGLIFALASAAVAWFRIRRSSLPQAAMRTNVLRTMVPALLLLVLTAAAMFRYNSRVTGNGLTLPYLADRRQYAIAPLFVWGSLRRPEPHYNSESLKSVYRAEVPLYYASQSWFGMPEILRKLKNIWLFFFGPLLLAPLLAFTLRRHGEERQLSQDRRYIGFLLFVMLAAALQVVWFYPHYAAPAFPVLCGMLVGGLKSLREWTWRGRHSGLFLSRAIPAACLLMALVPISAGRLGWRLSYWPLSWALGYTPQVHAPGLVNKAIAGGSKALIFVDYGAHHDPGNEWVYNAADILNAPVIWARRISPDSDRALLHLLGDRSAWAIHPDEWPLQLRRVEQLQDAAPRSVLQNAAGQLRHANAAVQLH